MPFGCLTSDSRTAATLRLLIIISTAGVIICSVTLAAGASAAVKAASAAVTLDAAPRIVCRQCCLAALAVTFEFANGLETTALLAEPVRQNGSNVDQSI
jgi:hypothetical protein